MADVIREKDIEILVSCAQRLIDEKRHSPIDIIKKGLLHLY
jgi:hypothetical protein